jgi:hypothetical protein
MAGTWGGIRSELESEFPGIDFDLLDGKIRSAYEDILGERDWSWLKGSDRVIGEAKYQAGTIALTAGSASIVGTDTAWTLELDGRELQVVGRSELYTFTVIDATTATLDRAFEGSDAALASYVLFRRTYALSILVKGLERVYNPRLLKNLDEKTRTELFNRPIVFGEPEFYAMAPSAGEYPVYKNVTFWPVPDVALSIDIDYQKAVGSFDGQNTGDSPPPEVYTGVIVDQAASKLFSTAKYKDLGLAGARAELARATLDRMHREENQRVPPSDIQIDDHFTSHELKRAQW